MARKRVVEAPSLHSWEDVNDALRQIAEAQIALGEIQSDMQKQILGAQKVAEEQSKPLNDNVAKLEREIKSFVTDHRDEMGKTKSVVLTFGEVGFRLSTSVSLPRAKEKLEEIIRRLKSRQMTDCIVVEEKVSKEALKKYGEDTVNAVGATWKQSDVFGYEVNIAKLEQIKATGAEMVITPCHNCWDAIRDMMEVYHVHDIKWSFLKPIIIDMMIVPDHLKPQDDE